MKSIFGLNIGALYGRSKDRYWRTMERTDKVLEDLLKLLEEAPSGHADLDAGIFLVMSPEFILLENERPGPEKQKQMAQLFEIARTMGSVYHYTSSIDDAAKLVPHGFSWSVSVSGAHAFATISGPPGPKPGSAMRWYGVSDLPPLSLCIAVLKFEVYRRTRTVA